VAIQPPRVENWNDWGKWRSVSLEVDRDRAVVAVADPRLDAADDARAAAEGDDRRVGDLAPLEHRPELVLVAWVGDRIRRMVEAPAERAHDVAVGLAVGVRGALVGVRGADLGELGRRLEPRRRKLDVLQRNRLLGLGVAEAQHGRHRHGGRPDLVVGELLVLVSPAPVLAAALRGGGHRSSLDRRDICGSHDVLTASLVWVQAGGRPWIPSTSPRPEGTPCRTSTSA
jgi:hypothetical protein